jgi:hypothetical protein
MLTNGKAIVKLIGAIVPSDLESLESERFLLVLIQSGNEIRIALQHNHVLKQKTYQRKDKTLRGLLNRNPLPIRHAGYIHMP